MGVEIHVAAAFFCLLMATVEVKSSMVEMSKQWKPNFGWEVLCEWQLFANDSLQSVRLSKSDQQFLIFRPERDGSRRSTFVRQPTMEFQADCTETQTNGVTGKCVINTELLQPMKQDLSYTCEVSGERPMFRSESKTVNIEPLVHPSDAVIERISENDVTSDRVNVNCTSSGLPAPNLVWTIEDQKIPADFSGGSWNFTSKLYDVWSSLSYVPISSSSHAVCTPEIERGGLVVRGQTAQYSAASVLKGTTMFYMCLLLMLALTR